MGRHLIPSSESQASQNPARVATAPPEYCQTNRLVRGTFMDSINILSWRHRHQLIFSFLRTSCSGASRTGAKHIQDLDLTRPGGPACAAMSMVEENRPFAQQLSSVYFTILSLFYFKLFVKISLAILSHFYIVKGNRKEAARIAAEFYGVTQGRGMCLACALVSRRLYLSSTTQENTPGFLLQGPIQSDCFANFSSWKIFKSLPGLRKKRKLLFWV